MATTYLLQVTVVPPTLVSTRECRLFSSALQQFLATSSISQSSNPCLTAKPHILPQIFSSSPSSSLLSFLLFTVTRRPIITISIFYSNYLQWRDCFMMSRVEKTFTALWLGIWISRTFSFLMRSGKSQSRGHLSFHRPLRYDVVSMCR